MSFLKCFSDINIGWIRVNKILIFTTGNYKNKLKSFLLEILKIFKFTNKYLFVLYSMLRFDLISAITQFMIFLSLYLSNLFALPAFSCKAGSYFLQAEFRMKWTVQEINWSWYDFEKMQWIIMQRTFSNSLLMLSSRMIFLKVNYFHKNLTMPD